MAKIIYLEDRINGLHCYTPEMGQRKPDVKLEARLSHYGNYSPLWTMTVCALIG